MVSYEEVVNCYRYILGRDPEDEKTVKYWMNSGKDLSDLRHCFFESDEFQYKIQIPSDNPYSGFEAQDIALLQKYADYTGGGI